MFSIFLILDYLISYYLPEFSSIASVFSPCFFITLVITTIYFYDNNKTLIFILCLGITYDLLFSNVLFMYVISFYLLYNFIVYLKSKVSISYFSYLLILIISIIFNVSVLYLLLFILGILNTNQTELIIIILRNLLSSIVFSFLFYITFKKIKSKV